MSQALSAIFDGLNPEQERAVRATSGPLLVLAGAGSGKTRVITHRIAHLIAQGVNPKRVMAVTFTNKAADEMRTRVRTLVHRVVPDLPLPIREPFVGTFHALGVYILKLHGEAIGIGRRFSILDDDDAKQTAKEVARDLRIDDERYGPLALRAAVSQLKNELVDASAFSREGGDSPYEITLKSFYAAYEARLFKTQSLDFDDLIMKPAMLFKHNAEARTFWQSYWEYIHIDEYQDTNHAQYALSRMLAETHRNIAVVGDIDQAIYSWRGADWRNILAFEKDFPDAQVIALEENYRSTEIILEAAHAVIARNTERKDVQLRTKNPRGDSITISLHEDERAEAAHAIALAVRTIASGMIPSEVAILYRTNAQSRALEEACIASNLPYTLVGGTRFYDRREVKDVLAYIKLARNPNDALAFKRIVNTPPRGIGKALLVKYFGAKNYTDAEARALARFTSLMEHLRARMTETSIANVLAFVIEDAGFRAYYAKDPEKNDRFENIEELLSVAKKFNDMTPEESVDAFLEDVALLSDSDFVETASERIQLLTAHAAKGLEFDTVIVTGLEEGVFPHALSQEEGKVEEERRLFYVAITRAKTNVHLSLAYKRLLHGSTNFNEPSRFLREIPESLLAVSAPFDGAPASDHTISYDA